MMIIGCDFHPSWQQIAWLDDATAETGERKLVHATGEANQFYEQLPKPTRIGMEATGNSQWFIERAQEFKHEIQDCASSDWHRCQQKPKAVARVAAARKLAVLLHWRLSG